MENILIEDAKTSQSPWTTEILKGLNEMRMNNTLCDVVINTQDDKYYSVHSSVLGASSSFFCQILTQSKSSGVGIILKLEKKSLLVESMINFLYTGQAAVSLHDLEDFRQMAEGYGLEHLTNLCGFVAADLDNVQQPEIIESEIMNTDHSQDDVLEYTEAVAVSSEDADLNAVEIHMENIHKSISSDTALNIAIETPSIHLARSRTVPTRSYNSGGPKKTWRDYKYSCKYCGKVFTSLSRMHGHQALHTGERKHECTICGQKFIQLEYLREHVSIHSSKKPFKCDFCEQTFRLSRHLKKHLQTHETVKKYECQLCKKLFKREIGLIQHQRIHNGEKPFQCNVCERYFRHKEALHRHKTTVHRDNCPYLCGFCNVGFRQLTSLKEHQKFCSMAAQKRDLMCAYCKKIFQTKFTLHRHILAKHPGKPSNYKKVDDAEIQKAALRSRQEESENILDECKIQDDLHQQLDDIKEHQVIVGDIDGHEVILENLEKGIIIQDGNNIAIETEENGHTVYQVLTFEMDGQQQTAVIATDPDVIEES